MLRIRPDSTGISSREFPLLRWHCSLRQRVPIAQMALESPAEGSHCLPYLPVYLKSWLVCGILCSVTLLLSLGKCIYPEITGLGPPQAGLQNDFWQLKESQHSSGTCTTGSKRSHPLPLWRKEHTALHWQLPVVAYQTPCWFWFLESLFTSSCHTFQTPNSSILVLLTPSSASNSQTCRSSEASLPPDTCSFSNDKVPLPPSHHLYYSLLLFSLLLQTALAMASIFFSLLWNSSKCLWAFSPS